MTYAIECKQSRADFLKDAGVEASARKERGELAERVEVLRRLMGVHLPECRLNRSLFLEYDSFDFGNWRHDGWARASRRLRRLERQVKGGVKFSKGHSDIADAQNHIVNGIACPRVGCTGF